VREARRAAGAHPQRVAPPRPAAPSSPPLRVVPRRRLSAGARRRRARSLLVAAGLVVAMGMLAVVGAHVVLTQRQFRLDNLNQELAQAQVRKGELQLEEARLESPGRIVATAEQRLHMVMPTRVVYLSPGARPGAKEKGAPATAPGTSTTATTATAATTTTGH
ncbi:MAG: hypothetical protein ACRD0L_17860, partial [Acidimicrobiales bacterium]